jgi:hypothetical protein
MPVFRFVHSFNCVRLMLYLVFEFERRSNSLFYVAKLANAKMGYLIQVFQLLLDSKLAILLFQFDWYLIVVSKVYPI